MRQRENEREKNMSTTSKKQVVVDLVPNNYEEQPSLVEGNAKVYKEKVATTIDDLDTLGKFVTLFQVRNFSFEHSSFFFARSSNR